MQAALFAGTEACVRGQLDTARSAVLVEVLLWVW